MKIEFHGAAKNVTGSCHYIEFNETKILIDCGLYQGGREMEEDNRDDFGFDPATIDFILLTHGHLDHCGRIPLLVKQGFKGTILATSATRELARLVMLDSARIQEEEAKSRNYWAKKKGKDIEKIEPLYDNFDALTAMDYFRDIPYLENPYNLVPGLQVAYFEAAHILGSASILIQMNEESGSKRILFSGDLGYGGRAILRDPAVPPDADVVVMETTYGDRLHKQLEPSIEELYGAINKTLERNGNVLIPSFALERTQEILYYLREGVEQGKVPADMQVYLDSPMAISATRIFQRHPECFDAEAFNIYSAGKDPFDLPGLTYTRDTQDSIALKNVSGAVIIAGSGMCTGGRIRHHLRHYLWKEETSVIFVGYAAIGTLARQIIDGREKVRIFREEIDVKAEIYTIGGFSAHGDQQDLLDWHARTGNPQQTFLVHGEEKAMEIFAGKLTNTKVEIPDLHQSYQL